MKGDNNLSLLYLMVFFCLLGTCSRPDQSDMKKHFKGLKSEIAALKSEIERDRSSQAPSPERWIADECRDGATAVVLRAKDDPSKTVSVSCAPAKVTADDSVERP